MPVEQGMRDAGEGVLTKEEITNTIAHTLGQGTEMQAAREVCGQGDKP